METNCPPSPSASAMPLVQHMVPARWRRRAGAQRALLAALLLGACDGEGPPTGAPPIDPPTATPAEGVHVLAGLSPDLPYTDLEPLREIVGRARFVALGESTHTSGGYYRAKARLFRFLVEELGFRVLAFETPWMEALPATRYVATCTGTPEQALAGLNGVWRDESVRDLLRWMCDYNRAHPGDPVAFFGFDVQEPWRSAPAVRAFLERAAPTEAGLAEPLFACLGASIIGSYPEFYRSQEYLDHAAGRRDATGHERCLGGISTLQAWITAHAPALRASSTPVAVEEALLALVALRAWEDQLWVPDPGGFQARDQGMAELLRRLHALHTPDRKTVVWAWNWHIARRYEEVRGFNEEPGAHVPRQGARAMGSFLHDALGPDYLPIALVGYRVETISGTPPYIPTTALAVEKRLHDLGEPLLLVDLRRPLPAALLPPATIYQISQEWGDPYRQFGALVFLDESPPMTYVGADAG